MDIASRLRLARESRGFSQQELAEAIGTSRGVITNIEYHGADSNSLAIHAICDVLEIREDWLLNGNEPMEFTDAEKSNYLLSEIYNNAKELSPEEQDYILDLIKAYQTHRQDIRGRDH